MMPDDTNRSTGRHNEGTVIHTGNAPSSPKCYSSTDCYVKDDSSAADVILQKDMNTMMNHNYSHNHHHHQGPHDDELLAQRDKEEASSSVDEEEEEGKEEDAHRLLSNGSGGGGVSPTIRYERRGRFAIWPAHLGLVCPSTATSNAAAAH